MPVNEGLLLFHDLLHVLKLGEVFFVEKEVQVLSFFQEVDVGRLPARKRAGLLNGDLLATETRLVLGGLSLHALRGRYLVLVDLIALALEVCFVDYSAVECYSGVGLFQTLPLDFYKKVPFLEIFL